MKIGESFPQNGHVMSSGETSFEQYLQGRLKLGIYPTSYSSYAKVLQHKNKYFY